VTGCAEQLEQAAPDSHVLQPHDGAGAYPAVHVEQELHGSGAYDPQVLHGEAEQAEQLEHAGA
jgi:hypothetical protein